jgi:uncharacterized protein (UPF0332 family)
MKEARFWLESAKHLLEGESDDSERNIVAVAQAVHSIIRANDALTLRFLNRRATRHGEAVEMFSTLVQLGKIPQSFSGLRTAVLRPAVEMKSKADYKGVYASKADAERWIARAGRFLEAVESLVS